MSNDKTPKKWNDENYLVKLYDVTWEVPRIEVYLNDNCITIIHNPSELVENQNGDSRFYYILPEIVERVVSKFLDELKPSKQ